MKRLPLNFKSVKLLNQTKDTVLYFLQKIRPQTKTFKCVYLLFIKAYMYATRYVLGNGTYNIKRMKHRNIDFSVVRFHSFTSTRMMLILPPRFFSFLILSHEKDVAE